MTKKKKIVLTGIGIILGLFMFILTKKIEKNRIQAFQRLNNTHIQGNLQRVSSSSGYFYITIHDEKFEFNSIADSINKYLIFSHIAKVGDSVYKPIKSDTLYLIKDEKIYKYKLFPPH